MDELWSEFNATRERTTFTLELTEEDARALADLCTIRHSWHSPEVQYRGMMIADRFANDLLPLFKRRRDGT